MALPNSNISTTLVGQTLGTSSRDVGTLCTHPNINKWSKWKPVRANKLTGINESDIIAANCGLDRNFQTQAITYMRPRGGDYSTPEYCRLGDFRNYNHIAVPPVNVEIVSVTRVPNLTISGPAYTLLVGFQYQIKFKLIPGDIDPTWINSQTSRIKNTDPAGGYGGVTWIIGPVNIPQVRQPDEVFTCEFLDPPELQQLLLVTGTGGGIRMEYCRYLGDASGLYETTGHYIEDDGYYESYRANFIIKNPDAVIDSTYDFNLFWNSLENQLQLRLRLVNNETAPLNVKIRLSYDRVETDETYTYNGNQFTLDALSSPLQFITLSGWSNGVNTYTVRAWLYIVTPDLSEVEISYMMQTTNPITITSGT